MNLNTYKIYKTYSPIYKKPNFKYPIETEGIFGETFVVEKTQDHFAFGILQIDGYKGWIKLDNLEKLVQIQIIYYINLNTLIKEKPDLKSKTLGNLVNWITNFRN